MTLLRNVFFGRFKTMLSKEDQMLPSHVHGTIWHPILVMIYGPTILAKNISNVNLKLDGLPLLGVPHWSTTRGRNLSRGCIGTLCNAIHFAIYLCILSCRVSSWEVVCCRKMVGWRGF